MKSVLFSRRMKKEIIPTSFLRKEVMPVDGKSILDLFVFRIVTNCTYFI